jgi:hypothetical protein
MTQAAALTVFAWLRSDVDSGQARRVHARGTCSLDPARCVCCLPCQTTRLVSFPSKHGPELLNIHAGHTLKTAAYDPTTPFKVVPVKKSKPNSRTGGPVAGPSSKPASGATGTKRKNTNKSPEPSDSDDLYGTEALAEDDEEVIVVPPEKKARKGRADTAANGKATSKGKGKAKAEPPPKTSRKAAEPIEVDDVEVLDETEVETVTRPPARAAAKSKKPATTTARNTKNSDNELSHLRQKLADVRDFSAAPSSTC